MTSLSCLLFCLIRENLREFVAKELRLPYYRAAMLAQNDNLGGVAIWSDLLIPMYRVPDILPNDVNAIVFSLSHGLR